jgi:iron complex outermembrane receptor protein
LIFGAVGASTATAQQATTPQPAPTPRTQTVPTTTATPAPAPQQQSRAETDQTTALTQAGEQEPDRVTVTGSLIATSPEDAPKPVEVYTARDLQEQGSPTVSEFIRSLTVSYGDDLGFGQSSPDVPSGAGFGNANLRGIGANGTLVLMNGRTLNPWNGAFGADTNVVPTEALEAVEILKDGAAATYGAGAVGGVINFRTRRDIDSPQISVEKSFYDGSDGAYKVDFLTGWAGDSSNILLSLSHSYEAPLLQSDRDFSNQPFAIDPAMWTLTGSNPGQFQPSNSNFYTNTGAIAVTYPGIQDMRSAADCTALGGVIANTIQGNSAALATPFVPNTSCAFSQAPFQSLVNESYQTRGYLEFNGAITDHMEFNFDITYSTSKTVIQTVPSGPASATAIDRATDAAARRGFTSNSCFACNYVVPVQIQNYSTAGAALGTYVRNPFIDDFMTRTGTTNVTLPDLGALYMGAHWRPYLWGGNPLTGNLREAYYDREGIIVNVGIKGEFDGDNLAGMLLGGVHYELSGQWNEYTNSVEEPDIIASRLQNALLGYGGPSCNAVDRVPTDYTSVASFNRTVGIQSSTPAGTGGCQWFNPFASSFPTSVANGAANPQFNAGAPALAPGATARPTGYQNSAELADWLYGRRIGEYENQAGTFNGLLSGQIPETFFALPGGEISWAVGSQMRVVEGEASTRDANATEQELNLQRCVWPDRSVVNSPAQPDQTVGMPGCTTQTSAFYAGARVTVSGQVPFFYYDTQSTAVFAQIDLPILDNLNVSYNLRHEDYNNGKLEGDIYSIAGKWDITDNLYVRASTGTNYRADGALNLRPGQTSFAQSSQTRFGASYIVNAATIVAPDIGAEDDKTTNIGVGWQSELGEGRIRASIDFFEILIDGQLATTSATTILTNVFGANSTTVATADSQTNRNNPLIPDGQPGAPAGTIGAAGSTNQYADCQASLISFLQFNQACVTGVTTALNLTEIDLFQVNGPGFITNGYDFKLDIAYPLFDGTIAVSLAATNNQVYKARGYSVNGILFDSGGQRLGRANYTSTGNESRRWRANGTIRWANEEHNISLRANYSSGVYNEAYPLGLIGPAIVSDIAATTTVNEAVYSTYGFLPKSYLDFDFNYIWQVPFIDNFELRATILNIFDKDPSAAQGRSGYYTATGNPRGRQFEIAFTKKF